MVKKILSRLKNDRGSSSVLVVFMLIIMVTFGALSLTAALANKRLGEKPGIWLSAYYIMDAQSGQVISEIDAALYNAELDTRTVMAPSISDSDAETFNAEFAELFIAETLERLDTLSDTITVEYDTASEAAPSVTFTVDGPLDEMTQKFLTVRADVVVPVYELSGGTAIRTTPDRFVIREWREWQEPFVDDSYEHEDLWDGSMDGFEGFEFEEESFEFEEESFEFEEETFEGEEEPESEDGDSLEETPSGE